MTEDIRIAGLGYDDFLELFKKSGWIEDRAEELARSIIEDRRRYLAMDTGERQEYEEKSRDEGRERHRRLWEKLKMTNRGGTA